MRSMVEGHGRSGAALRALASRQVPLHPAASRRGPSPRAGENQKWSCRCIEPPPKCTASCACSRGAFLQKAHCNLPSSGWITRR